MRSVVETALCRSWFDLVLWLVNMQPFTVLPFPALLLGKKLPVYFYSAICTIIYCAALNIPYTTSRADTARYLRLAARSSTIQLPPTLPLGQGLSNFLQLAA